MGRLLDGMGSAVWCAHGLLVWCAHGLLVRSASRYGLVLRRAHGHGLLVRHVRSFCWFPACSVDFLRARSAPGLSPRPVCSRNAGLALAQAGQPVQVDTGHAVRLDEHHEDAAAGPAAGHGARSPPVDDELSPWPAGPAGAASAVRGGHLVPKTSISRPPIAFPSTASISATARHVSTLAASPEAHIVKVAHWRRSPARWPPQVPPNRSVLNRSGG